MPRLTANKGLYKATFNMQYLSANAPIVCNRMAIINKGIIEAPKVRVYKDIAKGIIMPSIITPNQNTGAWLPLSNFIVDTFPAVPM